MYNWFLENILFSIGDVVFKTSFVKELKKWRKISKYNRHELHALQRKNLKDLLTYLSQNNEYYKKYLPGYTYIQKADPVEVLKTVPLLNKAIIKAHQNQLISNPFVSGRHKLILEKSSGSSGIQGSVFMSKKEAFTVSAIQIHMWEWAGFKLGNHLLQLGITPNRGLIKRLKDAVSKTTYKAAFNINEEDVENTLKKFENKQQAHFGGYASGIYAYASIAEQKNLKINFKSVISWGDKMFPHYRKKIESVFNTHVYDTYGCTEGLMIAAQCKFGSYHILTPHVFVEILDDDDNEVAPGKIGHVVVTRLDAKAFPLVRYKLGDLAIAADPKCVCECGMHYPMLLMVVGRDTDIVYTPKGKPLIVHFFTGIFEHEQAIKQYRIIQSENKNIVIEYITDVPEHLNILHLLEKRMNEKCDEKLPITFSQVTSIPTTKSGKPQFVVSLLKKQPVTA